MPGAPAVERGSESSVGRLQFEDGGDPCEVEAVIEKAGDVAEPVEVVVAVAACATCTPGWVEQAASFIKTEVLRGTPYEFRGHGDAIDALPGVGGLVSGRR